MLRSRLLRTRTTPRTSETPEPVVYDYSGIPTTECVCGVNAFKILVSVDPETNEISWYTANGYCYGCGARVTIPLPCDLADTGSMVTV